MRFVQTIEFRTGRIDEFNQIMDEWLASTEGDRIPTRGQLTRDRDRADTTAFAERLAKLCDGPPVFRNLDVLRGDEL